MSASTSNGNGHVANRALALAGAFGTIIIAMVGWFGASLSGKLDASLQQQQRLSERLARVETTLRLKALPENANE